MADTSETVYVLLHEDGLSISECYAGWTRVEHRAASICASRAGLNYHASTFEAVERIERTVALEREYLETLRTGLDRRTRGTR